MNSAGISSSKTDLYRNRKRESYLYNKLKEIKRDKFLLLLLLPGFLYFVIFRYIPMGGILIAFKKYSVYKGILKSPWNHFQYFKDFFTDFNSWRLFRNTLLLGVYSLIWSFPAPIIFALLLNEIKNLKFKKVVQTISYLPHFISTVIIVGMVLNFLSPETGIINRLIMLFGGEPIYFMIKSEWFRTVYISTGVWKGLGWSAIIYLAAISNINEELYDAAKIDGAKRLRQALHITLPGISSTISVLFIMNVGGILGADFERVLLLQNPAIYETADIISTFVYRRGIAGADFGYATAVGLAQSIVGVVLLVSANYISKKFSENSLW